jgi:chromosome segregation ATPase
MNSKRGIIILIIILLLLLAWAGYTAYSTSKANKNLQAQNSELNIQITDLNGLKDKLESEVDSLQTAYESLATENESLQTSVEEAERKVIEKDAVIKRLSKQKKKADTNLKEQIELLLADKAQLEASIYNLQSENDSLRMVTGQLTADLAASKSENQALADLNATIQSELKRLTLANFKASAFRVEVEQKKPKATAKSRRARRILVSFDLTSVSQEYQGVRTLYMVITDDKGTPIKNSNPINAQVKVNGQQMDIQAVKVQEVNIEESQRLAFTYDLEEKLKGGYYRVAVYTDVGLLGASSFRLR